MAFHAQRLVFSMGFHGFSISFQLPTSIRGCVLRSFPAGVSSFARFAPAHAHSLRRTTLRTLKPFLKPPRSRKFTYSPPPDVPWQHLSSRNPWISINFHGFFLGDFQLLSSFPSVFQVAWASAYKRLASSLPSIQLDAWDESVCPYDVRYCVPFPGISSLALLSSPLAGPGHQASSESMTCAFLSLMVRSWRSLGKRRWALKSVCEAVAAKDFEAVGRLGLLKGCQRGNGQRPRCALELNGSRMLCYEAWGSIINSLDALGVVAFLATILGHWA